MRLVLCFWIYLSCLVYFETYFMHLDLFWLLNLFWNLFYVFRFILVVEFIYFETYFILLDLIIFLDLIWLLDLFYDLFYVAHLPYFAINYNVEFDNLLIILFFTNLFATYSFIFFYYKSNIVFFVTIKL